MRKIAFTLAGLSLLATACVYTDQEVSLKPEIPIDPTPIGEGRRITLTTVDERAETTIGHRGAGGYGAEITVREDVAAVVDAAIAEGLEQQGFDTTGMLEVDLRELRVEVRSLKFTYSTGLLTGTQRTEAALKGICAVNGKREYESLYIGSTEKEVVVDQFAQKNEADINLALSQVLNNLLDDQDLLRCLSN